MKNLIPYFVHERFRARETHGRFQAVTLFVDISGFTPLTERLMQHEKDGAEVLTDVLNHIFSPLVAEIYTQGGFVTTFAGDAFTAIFPLREAATPQHALAAAMFIQDFFARQGSIATRYGRFEMGVKVGLSLGVIHWGILGAHDRHTYFFRGTAVDACARAEHLANRGEIVADGQIWPHVQPWTRAQPVDGMYRIRDATLPPLPQHEHPPELPRGALTPFILDAAIDMAASESAAEFRQVVPIFISFVEPDSLEALNEFTGTVLDLATDYGGYFNKLDFGDKGGMMLVLFGAPTAHENDLERAAEFLYALRDAQTKPRVTWRVGLAIGTAYAGVIGGHSRCEYTAIGDIVNLAARLMQCAEWGEVWVSQAAATQLQHGHRMHALGQVALKGKQAAVAVYRLDGPKPVRERALFSGIMVGREAELTELLHFLQPILHRQFAGLMVVYGDAGIGKSRLVYEAQQRLEQSSVVHWLTCPTDEILRHSLNPFRHLLRRMFDQSPEQASDTNLARFHQILDGLLNDLPPAAATIKEELDRTRSCLAALVDLRWPDSLYEQLEPRLRFENTLAAMKNLIRAESLRQPVVLQLDDLHWLDADSHHLLRQLTHNMAEYPIAILCTSRYRDDGSPVPLALDPAVRQEVLKLGTLTATGVRTLAVQVLAGDVTDELVSFLVGKTEGNPFFVEQLLLELNERQALVQTISRTWGLRDPETSGVPISINAVLIARLDRLVTQVKQVVQTAAVLGCEFEVQVLSQMLQPGEASRDNIEEAEAARVWTAVSEVRYIFRHALMRDAAYDMQLRSRLQALHRLAVDAIETVYRQDLTPHLADLAYHSQHSMDTEREWRYTRLAGEQAAAQFANVKAAHYFSRALELTPESDLDTRYALLLAREAVFAVLGQREQQQANLAALAELASMLGNEKPAEVALLRAVLGLATGAYEEAMAAAGQAIQVAQAAGARRLEALAYSDYGAALIRQGKREEAQAKLEQAQAIMVAIGDRDGLGQVLNNLGVVHDEMDDYEGARQCWAAALAIAQETGDRRSEGRAFNNLGLVCDQLSDYHGAHDYYEQALSSFRQIGFRLGQCFVLGNLGIIAAKMGDFATAQARFESSRQICIEIGDRDGEGRVLGNLGSLAADEGDFVQARRCYEQALAHHREVGNRHSQCHLMGNLGKLSLALGQLGEARRYLEAALPLSRELAARQDEAWILDTLGQLALVQGDTKTAEITFQDALTGFRDIGDRRSEAQQLAHVGLLHRQRGDYAAALAAGEQAAQLARALDVRGVEAQAWMVVGHARLGLGQPAEAREAYQQALAIWETLGQARLVNAARAGLAAAYTAVADDAVASGQVAAILTYLETGDLHGTEEPLWIYFTCYRVLHQVQDVRAAAVLADAYKLLQDTAMTIDDPHRRQAFLQDVPVHRQIDQAYAALAAQGQG